jgi:hypothetical protein
VLTVIIATYRRIMRRATISGIDYDRLFKVFAQRIKLLHYPVGYHYSMTARACKL